MCVCAEEGVQAYRGSYSSVTSSGSIRYELGVMRFPCNEIAMSDSFEKQILAPTVPLILRDMSISRSALCKSCSISQLVLQ